MRRLLPLLALGLCGCGYTMVKKSEVVPHRLPADSVEILSLQRQIDSLQTQHRADSVRYETLKATVGVVAPVAPPVPHPPATSDSVLQARDAEIASLHDQITKLNQELDRIKRRLAKPRP